MDEHHYKPMDTWDNGVYGTGRMDMPKNNNGIIALLLIAVIFLSGIVSGLSFMNIRLFQQLQQEKLEHPSAPISFSAEEAIFDGQYGDLQAYAGEEAVLIPVLKVEVSTVTEFEQSYFKWPAGLLVVYGEDALLGLKAGDILIRVGENPITDPNILNTLLSGAEPLTLAVYRDGIEIMLTYTP